MGEDKVDVDVDTQLPLGAATPKSTATLRRELVVAEEAERFADSLHDAGTTSTRRRMPDTLAAATEASTRVLALRREVGEVSAIEAVFGREPKKVRRHGEGGFHRQKAFIPPQSQRALIPPDMGGK